MIQSGKPVNMFLAAGLMLLVLLAGRGYVACGDFTYFFVAGTDFVDPMATPAPVWVQEGQGYDGQFFYRYALNPFDFTETNYGINVDLVPYRIQRVAYPLLTWIFSFGGVPFLVPYMLVLINVLAFFGILFFVNSFIKMLPGFGGTSYAPLLLCGLYMSLARDLSEVTELFFFVGALYHLYRNSLWKFSLFATLTLLSRETAIIAMLPIVLLTLYNNYRLKAAITGMGYLLLPFVVFACWKFIILTQTQAGPAIAGSGNLGWPFVGMIAGFRGNLDVSSAKNQMQLGFWMLYFIWQVILVSIVLRVILIKQTNLQGIFFQSLVVAWLCWLIFAVFLSPAIYIDDWSFVRVFSLWNMIGILILFFRNKPFPILFRYYSLLLVTLTIVRLIIRP